MDYDQVIRIEPGITRARELRQKRSGDTGASDRAIRRDA